MLLNEKKCDVTDEYTGDHSVNIKGQLAVSLPSNFSLFILDRVNYIGILLLVSSLQLLGFPGDVS